MLTNVPNAVTLHHYNLFWDLAYWIQINKYLNLSIIHLEMTHIENIVILRYFSQKL